MTTTPTAEQPEIETMLTEVRAAWPEVKTLSSSVKSLQDESAQLRQHVTDVRRLLASRHAPCAPRTPGQVTDGCARHLAAQFIRHCEKTGALEALCSPSAQRDALCAIARETLNLS